MTDQPPVGDVPEPNPLAPSDTATQPAEVTSPNLAGATPEPVTPREEAAQAGTDVTPPAQAVEPDPADQLLTDERGNVYVVLAEHQGVDRPEDAPDDWRPPVILARIDTTGAWTDPASLGLTPYKLPTGKDDD